MSETVADERLRSYAEKYVHNCDEYKYPYEREKLIRDWLKKPAVAANVVRDFERRAGKPEGKRILDLGFGNGLYAAAFARAGARMDGLEVNEELAAIARNVFSDNGLTADLRVYDGSHFPYEDATFDYAYSISVIEHVTDPEQFLREIARVLKPGGALYLTFPNRFAPRETHTGIYFLGYVPRTIARMILRTFWKRETVDQINLHFLSYFSFRRMLSRSGAPLTLVYEPQSSSALNGSLKRILMFCGIHHGALLGHIMLVLKK